MDQAVRYQGGPYVERDRPLPATSLLTKTHCKGYKYGHKTHSREADFAWACRQGYKKMSSNKQSSVLSSSSEIHTIHKAVHLIRNPFDNLISRMHNKLNKLKRLSKKNNDKSKTQSLELRYPNSRQGFLNYCRTFVDGNTKRGSNHQSIKKRQLPCAMEWVRYVEWHNHAVALFEKHVPPSGESLLQDIHSEEPGEDGWVVDIQSVHRLYYESYSSDYNTTVQGLVDFLHLPTPTPGPFHLFDGGNRTYLHYYTRAEFVRAQQVVQQRATPSCWKALQHYFGPSYQQQTWMPGRLAASS